MRRVSRADEIELIIELESSPLDEEDEIDEDDIEDTEDASSSRSRPWGFFLEAEDRERISIELPLLDDDEECLPPLRLLLVYEISLGAFLGFASISAPRTFVRLVCMLGVLNPFNYL